MEVGVDKHCPDVAFIFASSSQVGTFATAEATRVRTASPVSLILVTFQAAKSL
jgi:hypothetical protein